MNFTHAPARGGRRRWHFRASSLRVRLLVNVMLVIALVWAGWLAWQTHQMSDQQDGQWDTMMQSVGQQILLSLPAGVAPTADHGTFRLPATVTPRAENLSYQVWRRDGREVLRSVDAPATPWMSIDFNRADALGQAEVQGKRWRVYMINDADGRVQVQVAKSQDVLDADFACWLHRSLWGAGLLIVLLGAVSWWTICGTMVPVRTVRDALGRRSPLDLRPVATDTLPHELRPLVDGFNKLLCQLDAALRAERRFLADAAHELRTPLAVLTAQARLVQGAHTLAESQAAVAPLVTGIERASRLTGQLLDSASLDASPEPPPCEPVALHEIVSMVAHDFDAAARQARQRLLLDTEPCALPIDVDTLGVLLRNLIDNAHRYGGAGARIQVVCRRVPTPRGWRVMLGVRDDGPGVPAADRARIFDRFYRVPGTTSRGSGIGLSLVARIAELHGATIETGDGLGGRGFGVTVRFDAHPVEMPADCNDSGPAPLHGGPGGSVTSARPSAATR